MVQVTGQPKQFEAHQVQLSTGKVVILRTPKMKDIREAIKNSGASDLNQMAISWGMSEELVKQIIHQIDGNDVTLTQRQQLDELMSLQENMQLMSYVVEHMTGMGGAEGKPQGKKVKISM